MFKMFMTEWHKVASELEYQLEEKDVIKEFGSVQRFKEILSHQQLSLRSNCRTAVGEKPTEQEDEKFYEYLMEVGHAERKDDWWTMRKGGYDITYDLPETELLKGMKKD